MTKIRGACFVAIVLLLGQRSWAADTLPVRLDDREFWRVLNSLSETDGTFQFENVLSNEMGFSAVLPTLKKSVAPGGVYLGVGPEQNFTYIAVVRPKIAFIVDIRRQNMLEHLLYKAVFEMSSSRSEFLSILFSRRLPSSLSEKPTAKELFEKYRFADVDREGFHRSLAAIQSLLVRSHRFELSSQDLGVIERVYTAFREFGSDMTFSSVDTFGRGRGSLPTYADMMTATDGAGVEWSYLANDDNYRFVRDLEIRNLVVPLTGDFGGPKTISAVGKYLKDHNAIVSVFYISNVEAYLFRNANSRGNPNGGAGTFYNNVSTLPLNDSSTFVRFTGFGFPAIRGARQAPVPYSRSAIQLAPIQKTLAAVVDGRIQSYADIVPLPPRGYGTGNGRGPRGPFDASPNRQGISSLPTFTSSARSQRGADSRPPAPVWISLRLLAAVAGFLVYYLVTRTRTPRLLKDGEFEYTEQVIRGRGGVIGYVLGVPCPHRIAFALTREKPWDVFFKFIGFSREFQTGYPDFDQKVYIASDHPAVHSALERDSEARRQGELLLAAQVRRVWSDGKMLYLQGSSELGTKWLPALAQIERAIAKAREGAPAPHVDESLVSRKRFLSAIPWAIAAFSGVAFLDSRIHREAYHVNSGPLVYAGVLAALSTVAALLALTLILLRRSSRSHRVLVEGAVVLLLAVPIFGIQAVSDINRGLDSTSIRVPARVLARYREEHYARRGGRWFSHHIRVDANPDAAEFPPAIEIPAAVFDSVREGQIIEIEIGQGRLKIPWYRSINGVPSAL